MSDFTEHIYTLSDPRDNKVRYVGRTSDVYNRYFGHLSSRGGNLEKEAWIKELSQLGIRPVMTVIETVTYTTPLNPEDQTPAKREKFWIEHFEQQGEQLFNKHHRSENTPPIIYQLPVSGEAGDLQEENARLRAENARLRAIIKQVRQLVEQEVS